MIRAAENIEDGSPINAGRDDRITMNAAAEMVFDIINWRPKKVFHDTSKPTGVASRAADLTKTRQVLGYEPQVGYREGFKKTIDWYVKTHDRQYVKDNLARLLMER
jgi:nucleoside-diphosphate-sugar epimerase